MFRSAHLSFNVFKKIIFVSYDQFVLFFSEKHEIRHRLQESQENTYGGISGRVDKVKNFIVSLEFLMVA